MRPPGGLEELGGAGSKQWAALVGETLAQVLRRLQAESRPPHGLTTDLRLTPEFRAPDWPAFPARIANCLGTNETLRLLDWRPSGEGDLGRIRHHEEYLEWRVVRDTDSGRIRAIEMTTELPEYWEVLAGHEPERLLELVADFAGEVEVPVTAVYGMSDPLAATVPAEERSAGFRKTMLPRRGDEVDSRTALANVSPYNDGTKAICCMVHANNTLKALLTLVASAARPYLVRDPITGRTRFCSGSEAIEGLGAVAQDGRNSDPLIVERVARFATEKRQIAFDDPVGIYIRGVQSHELAQPDGEDVPEAWFRFGRGLSAESAPDGRPRHQRLTFRVPTEADFAVDDLIVRRTGETLRNGGQLAALVQLAAYIRTGPSSGLADVEPEESARTGFDCDAERASWEELTASAGGPG